MVNLTGRVCIDDAVASIVRLFCIAVDGGSEGGSRRAGWPVGACHKETNRKGFVSSCEKKERGGRGRGRGIFYLFWFLPRA
jgi:hypothetical protein